MLQNLQCFLADVQGAAASVKKRKLACHTLLSYSWVVPSCADLRCVRKLLLYTLTYNTMEVESDGDNTAYTHARFLLYDRYQLLEVHMCSITRILGS
jgi:hypothetical protein